MITHKRVSKRGKIMKIEKISETQVKFILSKSDLDERDIKMNELAYGSEKAHRLFQEMMQQAHMECNFESENTPLMVEAMPIGQSHVVIVVTKITETTPEGKPPLHLFPQHQANGIFNPHTAQGVPDTAPQQAEEPEPSYQTEGLAIFSFENLDDVALAAKRLQYCFMGQSRLYRCDSHYFLVIQEEAGASYALLEAELVLHEYGEKHISSELSENYVREHGEIMIEYQAVEKMAWYL